jgi:Na+/proline symporter
VQRYLAGSSVEQSRKSLLLSGFAKVPMQFVILLLGVLVWAHYAWRPEPVFFRAPQLEAALLRQAETGDPAAQAEVDRLRSELSILQGRHDALQEQRRLAAEEFAAARRRGAEGPEDSASLPLARLREADRALAALRLEGPKLLAAAGVSKPGATDADYVFTHFLRTEVPVGLAGLVLAAIFAAAMSSLVAPLNSLATSSVLDVWALLRRSPATQREVVRASRIATVAWGLLATFAAFWMGDLPIIEQVNRIGSVVYGSMFGVFILGRLVPRARGAVGAWSLATGILVVVGVGELSKRPDLQRDLAARFGPAARDAFLPITVEFMWFNLIGFVVVMGTGWLLSRFQPAAPVPSPPSTRA